MCFTHTHLKFNVKILLGNINRAVEKVASTIIYAIKFKYNLNTNITQLNQRDNNQSKILIAINSINYAFQKVKCIYKM